MRRLLTPVLLAALLLPLCAGFGQQAPGRQRLVLKDGSYQLVLRYEVKGDRVRFISSERRDGWEELPQDLVDWPATERYNHQNAPEVKPDPSSPAAQEAAALDREAAALKADEAGRQPEVAPGLRLPDESGVWALDSFNDGPRLVRIRQSDGDLNLDMGHSVKAAAIPQGGARDLIRLEGYKAVVSFHVPRPVFFIAIDGGASLPPREDALIVDTHGANAAVTARADKTQKASATGTYALVRLRVWKNERAASALALRALGTGGADDGSAEVVATERRVLPGGHWLRITPRGDLNLGQYSLIELLPDSGFNLDGWDFGVNPMAPENKGDFAPLSTDKDN